MKLLIPLMVVLLIPGIGEALAQNAAVTAAAGAAAINSNNYLLQKSAERQAEAEANLEAALAACGNSYSCREEAEAEFERELWLHDYCGDSYSCRQDATRSGVPVGTPAEETLVSIWIKIAIVAITVSILIVVGAFIIYYLKEYIMLGRD